MERIYLFLPSIVILACIAGATFLYLKLVIKRFGDSFKSVEWHEKNQEKVGWILGMPRNYIWAPVVEELIFRAPLIIAFSALSSIAWYGIFASSGLFALIHWHGKKITMPEILDARNNNEHESDDVDKEVDRLHHKAGTRILIVKALHVATAFPAGIVFSYYGIKYQSIWLAFGLHSAWNIFMPIVLTILMIIGALALSWISCSWKILKCKRRSNDCN